MHKLRLSGLQFEISIPTKEALTQVANLLSDNSINRIGITDKKPLPINLATLHEFEVMPHYSLAVNYGGSEDNAAQNLKTFLEKIQQNNINNFLLVSGPTKRKYDTLKALKDISNSPHAKHISVAVAFNPFLPAGEIAKEEARLRQKLEYKFVNKVYLQIGIDSEKAAAAARFARSCRPEVQVYACLLVPTTPILKSLKSLPWKGVTLPKQYLDQPVQAKQMTVHYLEGLLKADIKPYMELIPFGLESIALAKDIINDVNL